MSYVHIFRIEIKCHPIDEENLFFRVRNKTVRRCKAETKIDFANWGAFLKRGHKRSTYYDKTIVLDLESMRQKYESKRTN